MSYTLNTNEYLCWEWMMRDWLFGVGKANCDVLGRDLGEVRKVRSMTAVVAVTQASKCRVGKQQGGTYRSADLARQKIMMLQSHSQSFLSYCKIL
jgi:hypothetical protein